MIRHAILLLFLLSIMGCGFKLRGLEGLPSNFNNVALVVQDIHHELEVILKDKLQAYKVHVNSNPIKADYVLVIEKSLLNQQITSVSANTTPRQYELFYTIVYSLNQKGTPLISANIITVRRQFTLNNDRVLGSIDEGSLIVKEMYAEAAAQMISRISKKLAVSPQ